MTARTVSSIVALTACACLLHASDPEAKASHSPTSLEIAELEFGGGSGARLADIAAVRPPMLPSARFGALFDYFDGFETYVPETNLLQDPMDWIKIRDQVPPSGIDVRASFFFAVVDWENPDIQPPIAEAPLDPFGGGGAPGDPDPGTDLVLLQGERFRGEPLGQPFLGLELQHAYFVATEPVVVKMDFYLPSLDSQMNWNPVSFHEGFFVTRLFFGGVLTSSGSLAELTNEDGFVDRYAVLSRTTEQPCFATTGHYFAVPREPAEGLAGLEVKSGEWFTIAAWLLGNELRVFVRDSQTDGSNGVLIDDPDDVPGFESGWCEIFPGKPAEEIAPGVWTSYGVALTADGRGPNPWCLAGATSVDALVTILWGDDVIIRDNLFMDNYTVTGPEFCRADLDLDGDVDSADLALLLGFWGTDDGFKIDRDDPVGSKDLAILLGSWGPCGP